MPMVELDLDDVTGCDGVRVAAVFGMDSTMTGGGTISTDAPTTRTTGAGDMAAMRRLLPALLLAVCAALVPGTAGAIERVVEVPSEGPGPARFDRVFVHQVGPESAKRILVLMPGTIGGAGNFALLAQDLAERVPGLQVWSIDRRSQSLEDTSAFARLEAGRASLQETFDYYLGWIFNGGIPAEHFEFLDPGMVPFAREWGMKTALDDARQVVRLAVARAAG